MRGLSANIVGRGDSCQRVVLFGGSNAAQTIGRCSNELWGFNPELAIRNSNSNSDGTGSAAAAAAAVETVFMQLLDTASDGPCARVFHTCTTAGRDGSRLLVYGGQDEAGRVLNDLWLCDSTEVLASVRRNYERQAQRRARAAAQAERVHELLQRQREGQGKGEGGAEELEEEEEEAIEEDEPLCTDVTWTCLLESTVVGGRYLHSAYSYMTPKVEGTESDDNIYLCVMGGMMSTGYASNTEVHTVCINLQADLVNEGREDEEEPQRGPAVVGDFTKNTVNINSKCANLTGMAIATLTTPDVPCAVVIGVNGNAGTLLVTDDSVSLALLTKKNRIARIKELKAAAAAATKAANPDTQMAEEEDTTKLPSKVTYPNGDVYEGELKLPPGFNEGDPIVPLNLIRQGKGRMSYKATGESFEGIWIENVRAGFGKSEVTIPTAHGGRRTRYEGQYVNDVKCGDGNLSYIQSANAGLRPAASASNSQVQAGGGRSTASAAGGPPGGLSAPQSSVLVSPEDSVDDASSNLIYQGRWADNTYSGKGELRYPNGDVYVGQFKGGKRHGKGVLTPASVINTLISGLDSASIATSAATTTALVAASCYYKGEWEHDQIAGIGEVKQFHIPISEHSKVTGIYEGNTKNGIPWGTGGYCAYKDGSEYLGEWKQGKKNGVGVYIYTNLDKYEGKFVGNRRCGAGKLMCKNGDVHDGLWDHDKPNGYGRRSSVTKEGIKVEDGMFSNGEFKG